MVSNILKIGSLFLILLVVSIISLASGEIDIPFSEVVQALRNNSTDVFNHVVTEIRLPRILVGIFVGATLAASGFLTSIAMRNDLADSGILGVQSGATIGALTVLLAFPTLSLLLPLASFIGGLLAFLLILVSTSLKGSFNPTRVVLVGVAINSMATSIIGILTLLHTHQIRGVLTWLNGSIATVNMGEARTVMIYSSLFILVTFLLMPLVKILLLSDQEMKNIGFNPKLIRLILAFLAVLLASVSVAFVGILSFVGIIARQIAKGLERNNLILQLTMTLLIGSLLVVSADLVQRLIFSPVEIPAGILIGLVGAPIFIFLSNAISKNNT